VDPMLPALRLILERAPPDIAPSVLAGKLAWLGPSDLAGYALYRLRQVAPAEEEKILLEDVAAAHPKFLEAAIRELPAQDIALADDRLAGQLKADSMTALSAVPVAAKFGTRHLMKPMLALYKGPQGPCMIDEWFVAYFARVDSEQGAKILAEAMAARTDRAAFNRCFGRLRRWFGTPSSKVKPSRP
jgi:hypothetical protein